MRQIESADLGSEICERAHVHGEFWLRSGGTSNVRFDKYRFESDPLLLRAIAEELVTALPSGVDALAGLTLGGIPLATVCSQRCGLPTVFVRKQPKGYGMRRVAEGMSVDNVRLAVIEDVVTTGVQVIDACHQLRSEGASIVSVMCVIDREEGASNRLAREGLVLRSLFTLSELRQTAGSLP